MNPDGASVQGEQVFSKSPGKSSVEQMCSPSFRSFHSRGGRERHFFRWLSHKLDDQAVYQIRKDTEILSLIKRGDLRWIPGNFFILLF